MKRNLMVKIWTNKIHYSFNVVTLGTLRRTGGNCVSVNTVPWTLRTALYATLSWWFYLQLTYLMEEKQLQYVDKQPDSIASSLLHNRKTQITFSMIQQNAEQIEYSAINISLSMLNIKTSFDTHSLTHQKIFELKHNILQEQKAVWYNWVSQTEGCMIQLSVSNRRLYDTADGLKQKVVWTSRGSQTEGCMIKLRVSNRKLYDTTDCLKQKAVWRNWWSQTEGCMIQLRISNRRHYDTAEGLKHKAVWYSWGSQT